MKPLAYSRSFPCTPAALWPWLVESDKLKTWLHGMETHVYETSGPVARGMRYRMEIREGRGLSHYAGEVMAVEPERLLSLRVTGGCGPKAMTIENDYRLAPEGRGVKLDYVCRITMPPGILSKIMGLLGPLMMKSMLKRFFNTLEKNVKA